MRKVGQGMVKVASLVLDDFDIYPRANIEAYQIHALALAIAAGEELPPIIVWRSKSLVIDGLHRCKAMLQAKGPDAEIEAVFYEYGNRAEAFLHAYDLNSRHGVALNTHDKLHCVIVAQRLGIQVEVFADRMNLRLEEYRNLLKEKFGLRKGTHELIPLKATVRHMAGKVLSRSQERTNERLGGMQQTHYANQVIMLLEDDMVDWENPNLVKALVRLRDLLVAALRGRK